MLRLLFLLAIVFLAGLGLAWLADRPGEMIVMFGGYEYRVSLVVAAVVITSIVIAVMLIWWLVKSIWNSPHTISRYFRVRRRDRGYQALSTGMIAAGAGDAILARKKKKEAMKLINADQEPLVHLLDAQASLLEGNHEAAREKFRAMLDDPETRLLGLRGLFLEAERHGEREAARHFAAQAADVAPQLAWAAEATLEERAERGDWDGALRLVEAQQASRHADREALKRRRAVLLTAKAMDVVDADPAAARSAALEAVKLAPDFVPATLAAARALFRQDELRKGAKLLETLWKKDAHPQIADLYVHARHGDSVQDRLKRAQKLEALRNNNAQSSYAVARAALDAGDFKLAREEAEASIRLEPRESAFLLMADIEEADTGEQGKVRQWLARALRAPRDAAWVADGYVSENWAPFSPVTSRIDAFAWRVPVERVAHTIEAASRAPDGGVEPLLEAPKPETEDAPILEIVPEASPIPAPMPAGEAATETRVTPVPDAVPAPEKPSADAAVAEAAPAEPQASAPEKRDADGAADIPPKADVGAKPVQSVQPIRVASVPQEDTTVPTRPPDDPGVDDEEDDTPEQSARVRLF